MKNDEKKGYIHSVETCGTVDGPGLRYVAFFQGCVLRCKYCHNPDTWKIRGGTEMTADELLSDALKYKSYMKFGGGGFTASGGEPLLQKEFIAELFSRLKSHGIHTAFDTSGNAGAFKSLSDFDELFSCTDLALLDIKATRPDKYRGLTGAEIHPALEFAEYLNKKKIPVWIRYVIIPGLTDAAEDTEALAEYLKRFSNIQRVELLPFHKAGEYKWEAMKLAYMLKDTSAPDEKNVRLLKKALENHGLPI
jgi:pyruvate formate lyase activating enzyme